jgi:hypothetical protein
MNEINKWENCKDIMRAKGIEYSLYSDTIKIACKKLGFNGITFSNANDLMFFLHGLEWGKK